MQRAPDDEENELTAGGGDEEAGHGDGDEEAWHSDGGEEAGHGDSDGGVRCAVTGQRRGAVRGRGAAAHQVRAEWCEERRHRGQGGVGDG